MPKFICVTCGVQYPESEEPQEDCVICQDERQYVGWDGQKWTTLNEMQSSGRYKNDIKEEETNLYSVITRPEFAIGQRAFFVRSPKGNILWDCITYLDERTAKKIEEMGGLKMIAISHPHYYSSIIEWSDRFGGIPIYVHEMDRKWVVQTSPQVSFWQGESKATGIRGKMLVNLGGHFDGGTVLHWSDGADGKGVVLSGDILQVVEDRRWVSFMYSYPNLIPLSEPKVRQIQERISKYRFDRIYGAFEGRQVMKGGQESVKRSAERYIRYISL